MRDHLARGVVEARSLAFLMIGCFLGWVAQLPRFVREAEGNRLTDATGPDFSQLAGSGFFIWLMFLPLVFYFLAWVTHLVSAATGGRGTSATARLAMFWSWLAAAPLVLLTGVAFAFTGASVLTNLLGILWIAVFAAFWWLCQREAARGPVVHGA
jgi:hypothetical protein